MNLEGSLTLWFFWRNALKSWVFIAHACTEYSGAAVAGGNLWIILELARNLI
jgi:hypothetical protein